jgi:hypothetical protein
MNNVYKIDDGAFHWVIAQDESAALRVCEELYGDPLEDPVLKELSEIESVCIYVEDVHHLRRLVIGGLPVPHKLEKHAVNVSDITQHDFEPRWDSQLYAYFRVADLRPMSPQFLCGSEF